MPKMRMVMYCDIADAGPDEPWLEKFVESVKSRHMVTHRDTVVPYITG
jgi:hypothetical protein